MLLMKSHALTYLVDYKNYVLCLIIKSCTAQTLFYSFFGERQKRNALRLLAWMGQLVKVSLFSILLLSKESIQAKPKKTCHKRIFVQSHPFLSKYGKERSILFYCVLGRENVTPMRCVAETFQTCFLFLGNLNLNLRFF